MNQKHLDFIKDNIIKKHFRNKKSVALEYPNINPEALADSHWIIDIKRDLMNPQYMKVVTEIFWEKFQDKDNLQIGALETAGIALAQAIVLSGHEKGKKVTGFYVRKSRKRSLLYKFIEGDIYEGGEIILVDDIVNTLYSTEIIMKQLEAIGRKTDYIFTIIKYRDDEYYTEKLKKDNTKLISLFELNDFKKELNISNRKDWRNNWINSFDDCKTNWVFRAGKASFNLVNAKSAPVIDEEKLYFGAQHGEFFALSKKTGEVIWKKKVGFYQKDKAILSSPALYKDMVIFGSYDGNLYALDKKTGNKKWIFWDADHIGSSPAVAEELESIFIGLEFNLFNKQGGIACINALNGKMRWNYITPAYTHSSPKYISKHKQVVIGSNDGCAYLFEAKSGKLIWKFQTSGGANYQKGSAFSDGDIKHSFAYDEKRDLICFSSIDSNFYILKRKTGELVFSYKSFASLYATPYIYQDKVFFTGLDKIIYCIDLEKLEVKWKFTTSGRIFATPMVCSGLLYCGSNNGFLYELDIETGKSLGYVHLSERIVNKIAYDEKTKTFYAPTIANEIYSINKNSKN